MDNAIIMNDFIGVSAGVYKANCGSWLGNAGFANKQKQLRSDKHTLHRIASLTKPMTAVAIMQLYEQDLIELDLPIQKYLPEFPVKPQGDITIRQLLKHTSGVQHYSSDLDVLTFTHYDNLVDGLDAFKDKPLSFAPGTGYEYTTYGYTILGAIIEKVTGQSYREYMQQQIFIPAGMTNSDIENAKETYENKADLYIKLKGTYIRSPKTDLSVKYPAGGIHTTAEDLLKFGKAILENTLIDSSTLDLMITSTDTLKQGTPYGFGWFVDNDQQLGRVIAHAGSQSGVSSFFQISIDQGIVAVSLANNFGSDGGVHWLVRDLTNLISDMSKIEDPVNYFRPQADNVLQQFVGKYKSMDREFIITKDGDQLFSKFKNYPPIAIYPRSQNTFFIRPFNSVLSFNENSEGVMTLVSLDGEVTNSHKKVD